MRFLLYIVRLFVTTEVRDNGIILNKRDTPFVMRTLAVQILFDRQNEKNPANMGLSVSTVKTRTAAPI